MTIVVPTRGQRHERMVSSRLTDTLYGFSMATERSHFYLALGGGNAAPWVPIFAIVVAVIVVAAAFLKIRGGK